ncbi:MAG: prolyl oligopeptidase family serine peptidase [Candidatus Aminicenantes bacterium]|nr:prolyl oligopeptidase family serine peptidase [Candidatus Aminicenantes bacterium]
MKPRSSLFMILVIILAASAAPPALRAEDKPVLSPWTADDLINQEMVGNFAISPDGAWAVWTKSTTDKEKDGRVSRLYLSNLKEEAEPLQLTRGDSNDFSPRWSPSGKLIGFLSARKAPGDKSEAEGAQVWLLDRRGGEPWKLTALPMGVSAFEWIDENRLLLLAREAKTLLELEQKEKKDTSQVVEDQEHMTPQRLSIFDIKAGKAERLTTNPDQISNFELSRDRKLILTRNEQSVRYGVDKKIKPKFFLVELETGAAAELFPERGFKPSSFAWAWDSTGFYFTRTQTSDTENEGPGAEILYYYDLAAKSHAEVPIDWGWGMSYYGFIPRQDGFIASLANGARPKWRRFVKTGGSYTYKEIEGKHYPNIYGFVLQAEGATALYGYSTASQPVQWYVAALDGPALKGERLLLEPNGGFKDKPKAKTEVLKWTGALGEGVEGILYYPHDFKEGKRYPLMLSIHGGPTGWDSDAFDENWGSYPNLLAQKGSFVLLPNYHGSGNYGQAWAESIKGRYYELELEDIVKGIDVLIQKGMVDPDRLGTMGWSNGGILTIGLSVWTDRFKVAGVGAADVNWTSDYGNCSFGVSFDNYYFKGTPWDELEHYIKKSPLFHLKNMKVPTIIFHGSEDTNVPYEQGWEYYRAIQVLGLAPVRFISFPGEPHGLRLLTHQKRKVEEELAWFDRYFFKTETARSEALKKGSPLDIQIKKLAFARSGENYGVTIKGTLVPETVASDGTNVGRFEVTRAQWAAFDGSFKYDAGTGDNPATGMSFAQARKYVQWLSGRTGQKYRLPTVAEAEKLSGKGGADNTLDWWSGYSLNPDDARLVLEKIKTLKGAAPLLLPVDKFDPVGDGMLYGLGGNASEWAVDDKGNGRAVGACAVTSKDPQAKKTPPPAAYTGLRVVKEGQ